MPTFMVATRPRKVASTLNGVNRPVAGFSGEGMPSMNISKRVASESTFMVWVFRVTSGSAQISIVVFSGPLPARLKAAATLTLAGKASAASRAVPSNTSFAEDRFLKLSFEAGFLTLGY